MIDLALLRANLTNDKAEMLIQSNWAWEEHYGFDVDDVDAYESLEFHLWSERENVWKGVEEEHDHVFLECPLAMCRLRDRITDAWARIKKVRRSPDERRYIFWFVEYDDRGVEHDRIWYIQGLEQIRRASIPYAKLGEDPEMVGEHASGTDSDQPSPLESVASPEEEEVEPPASSVRKRPAAARDMSSRASSSKIGPPPPKAPPWKRQGGNLKEPPWKKPSASSASLRPIRKTVDTDLMYRFFTPEEAAQCMRTQERPGWPDQWNPVDDPLCPAYHLWFQRDAIFNDTQEGYHVRVKFKCFDPPTQMDTVRFVGTVIMSYVLDNGALFLFFLDTPQGEGKIVGVAGVEVNSTTYISHREMHLTFHQYRGDSMRVMRVDEEPEVERVHDWEIHFLMDGRATHHPLGVNMVMTSAEPTEEKIEVVNQRMVALEVSQCSEHPDDDVAAEVDSLRKILNQPSWAPPCIKKAEPEYVNDIERVLESLTELSTMSTQRRLEETWSRGESLSRRSLR